MIEKLVTVKCIVCYCKVFRPQSRSTGDFAHGYYFYVFQQVNILLKKISNQNVHKLCAVYVHQEHCWCVLHNLQCGDQKKELVACSIKLENYKVH
jgi:hypothetical protein